MDRRGFIKSTGIGLAALLIAGKVTLADSTPVPTTEAPKLKDKLFKQQYANVYEVNWKLNEAYHRWEAIVKGYNKKTMELMFVPISLPEAETHFFADDPEEIERMKARLVYYAKQHLIETGCVPL